MRLKSSMRAGRRHQLKIRLRNRDRWAKGLVLDLIKEREPITAEEIINTLRG